MGRTVTEPDETRTEHHPEVAIQATAEAARERAGGRPEDREVVFKLDDVTVAYDGSPAVSDIEMDVFHKHITALIGPSGCGKSTLIRAFNRMNDLIPSASVTGSLLYHGQDLYAPDVDPVEVRKRIGMVFQKPNPFPKSVYDNVAFGPRIMGMKGDMDEIVQRALEGAALWDEVKDRLDANAFGMSGGQQQRLCIARCLAVDPDVILMDEPCSALDPISTGTIEDLMLELKERYSIVIVTHNMQQAARVSDRTAFFTTEVNPESDTRTGLLIEVD
ncbi:MAG TPA: phosphate ABC transporter ATP-binding protein, partial [Solirubrobacterales bacterium]